jgi:flavin-dependent dehydrogenase
VRSFDIGANGAAHRVRFAKEAASSEVECRWLVDASGRASLVKRKLGLEQDNAHDANAVWFRLAARVDVNEWSSDSAWLARCSPPLRWLSTNHLCGEGYWAWLIPLSSGSHSVGIVCDAKLHPLATMNTFEKALEWFRIHQPRLAQEVASKRHLLQDFCFLRDFSYGCKQVFSGDDRWALTGEAGVFLDPFYSPGSDFIAISNTYITDLIALANKGDEMALQSLTITAEYLGEGISNLVHGIYPETVVVGGKITAAWPLIEPIIRKRLHSRYTVAPNQIVVRPASVDRPGLYGAIPLALQHYFKSPGKYSALTVKEILAL